MSVSLVAVGAIVAVGLVVVIFVDAGLWGVCGC